MSHSFHPFRASVAAVSLATLAAITSLGVAAPAQSVPADPACPDAVPTTELPTLAGQPVDGLTVSSGNTPDPFTGNVLGVVNDGIAPGLDMIMVRLTSPEIDRVGGIWAGMSGSPVYAADGRLIGAVAYGLALGPSPVAGVTPAAEMKRLLGDPDAPTLASARKVELPARMQQRIVAEGDATAAEADAGMRRLPVPVGVSGMLDSTRLAKAAKELGFKDARYYRAGRAAAAAGDAGKIFAGSNLAASLSYGDFSAVGTGTTTMVCAGKAVAFGHPFAFAGNTSLTMHAAEAVYVQEDPTLFPFKVSNPSGPVGTISEDRLSGISGLLDQLPETALVRHRLALDTGRTRIGETRVSVPDFLPDATFFAQLVNQDRLLDRIGRGSSRVHFTVTGTTKSGVPFTLERTNRFASGFDISFESAFEAADMVFALNENEFTDIDIDAVRFDTAVGSANRFFKVGRVEQKIGTSYRVLREDSVVRVKPGRRVVLRVTLNSFRNLFGTKQIQIATTVPADAIPGTFGSITVGARGFQDEFEFEGAATAEPKSFGALLTQLASSPRNDQLGLTLGLLSEEEGPGVSQESVRQAFDVVRGSRSFAFRVAR